MTPFDTTWYVPATAEVAQAELARETAQMLARIDLGHIYVAEFTSGVVKVGKTTNPRGRLASHALFAQIHGGDVRQSWVSGRHQGCGENERALIAFCSSLGPCVAGREYFRAPFELVRSRASLLAANRLAEGDLDMSWQAAHERLPVPVPPLVAGGVR